MIEIMLISGVLAWLTYLLVERPVRFGSKNVGRKIGGLVTAMIALGAVCFAANRSDGFPIRIPAPIRSFMADGNESSKYWRSGKCLMLPDQGPDQFAPECAGHGGRPLVLLWGDSYTAALYPGFKHYAEQQGFDVAEYSASTCAPLIGYVNPERRFCKPSNDYTLQKIRELRPDVVVFFSTWSYGEPDLRGGLHRTIPLIRPFTKKVVLLGPPATWLGEGLSGNVLDNKNESNNKSILPERTWYRSNDKWTHAIEQILQSESTNVGIDYISIRGLMCNDEGCLARIGPNGAELTAFDSGHFTHAGSIFMAGQV